jgi:hypothetical protein
MNARPAGAVTGFGPLNEGIQSAIDEASSAAARNVVPALSAEMTRRIRTDILPGLLSDPRFSALAAPAGQAAGDQFFVKAAPALFVAASALAILAGAGVYYVVTHRGCR